MTATGRIKGIDFIKGLATIAVILMHTIPESILKAIGECYHLCQAVPLFFLITIYLGFRNLEHRPTERYYSWHRIQKLFVRVWLPLIILAVIQSLIFYLTDNKEKVLDSLFCVRNGPGSYYVWCYTQLWILIPVLYYLVNKLGILLGGAFLMFVSGLGDFVWKEIGVLYPGICCSRYLFLGVVAYIILKEIPIKKIWSLIVMSFVYLTYVVYVGFSSWTEPFMPYKWEQQTGPSYFYSLFLFVVLLRIFERRGGGRASALLCKLGRYSWEVFLMQMFLLGTGLREIVDPITENKYIETFIVIVATLFLSIMLGILYNWLMRRVAEKLI